jgi:hypothetical protein
MNREGMNREGNAPYVMEALNNYHRKQMKIRSRHMPFLTMTIMQTVPSISRHSVRH